MNQYVDIVGSQDFHQEKGVSTLQDVRTVRKNSLVLNLDWSYNIN